MQTIKLICIGKLKERYWQAACEEYEKRLRPFCKFEIVELPESRLSNHPSEGEICACLETEGKRILEAVGSSLSIPLCIEGKELTSTQLAEQMETFAVTGGSTICFVIGSSYGLSESVKKAGKMRLSMSPMTFPHQLARVMLCEQIYRAFQILHNGKYHK